MSIFAAIIFMLFCWIGGVLFVITFGISTPQYGSKVKIVLHNIQLTIGALLLFILIPFMGFCLAL